MDIELRQTTEHDLLYVLSAESHEENRPFINVWPEVQHREALDDEGQAHPPLALGRLDLGDHLEGTVGFALAREERRAQEQDKSEQDQGCWELHGFPVLVARARPGGRMRRPPAIVEAPEPKA